MKGKGTYVRTPHSHRRKGGILLKAAWAMLAMAIVFAVAAAVSLSIAPSPEKTMAKPAMKEWKKARYHGFFADTDCIAYVHPPTACEWLQNYSRDHGANALRPSLLGAPMCAYNPTIPVDACAILSVSTFPEELMILPIEELRASLGSEGLGRCVAGPLRLGEIHRSSATGRGSATWWSIHRKSCVGSYRDLTSQELVSVLHHYWHRWQIDWNVSQGIIAHGDSMQRNIMTNLISIVRGTVHTIDIRADFLYLVHPRGDEVITLRRWRSVINNIYDDKLRRKLPLRTRCLMQLYFTGYMPEVMDAETCLAFRIPGLLLPVLFLYETYVENLNRPLLNRLAPSPLWLDGLLYWYANHGHRTGIKPVFRGYLDYLKSRYENVEQPSIHPLPHLLFASTSPDYVETAGKELDSRRTISHRNLLERNDFFRSIPWTSFARNSTPGKEVGSAQRVRRYLLDLDLGVRLLGGVVVRKDPIHFTCAVEPPFVVHDGYICQDIVGNIPWQWIAHIVADELLVH